MVLLTMVARVADGLPLAASIQEDEQVRNRTEFEEFMVSKVIYRDFFIN